MYKPVILKIVQLKSSPISRHRYPRRAKICPPHPIYSQKATLHIACHKPAKSQLLIYKMHLWSKSLKKKF